MAKTSVVQRQRTSVAVLRMLKPIVPDFLRDTTRNVDRIKTALKTDDFSTIDSVAHSLKGSGKSYGFDVVTEMGEALQKAVLTRDRQHAQSSLAELSDYLDSVEIMYV